MAFVGYQANGTPGRLLVDGTDTIRIHGKVIEIRARVTRLEAFSAHADEDELVRWVAEAVPGKLVLVHGEQEGRDALARRFHAEFGIESIQPKRGDTLRV